MDQILDHVDGAVGIADDVAVYARSDEEHDQVIHFLMKVAAKNGLVFNSGKCTIKTPPVIRVYLTYIHASSHHNKHTGRWMLQRSASDVSWN